LRASRGARLLIVSQAPGRKVHQTGIPWNDASGDHLRDWMKLDRSIFYDEAKVAIVPIGFCYPGAQASGGDKPPRSECAPLWHPRIFDQLPYLQLTLLVGQYSQMRYLGPSRKRSITETVKAFAEYGPTLFPLPHPSWRSRIWMQKQPWFEQEIIPQLRKAVQRAISGGGAHSRFRINIGEGKDVLSSSRL
jgi:uracil-DNA glycosylase